MFYFYIFSETYPFWLLISAISVSVWFFIFRPKWYYLGLGAIALVLAYFFESLLETPVDLVIMLIFVAPVVEEIIKFLLTIQKKFQVNVKAGIGIGLGFALFENALYFQDFSLAFPSMLLTVIVVREFTDPILHSTTTSIATRGWKKFRYVLLAIFMHSTWNILTMSNNYTIIGLLTVLYAFILLFSGGKIFKKSDKNQKENIVKF